MLTALALAVAVLVGFFSRRPWLAAGIGFALQLAFAFGHQPDVWAHPWRAVLALMLAAGQAAVVGAVGFAVGHWSYLRRRRIARHG